MSEGYSSKPMQATKIGDRIVRVDAVQKARGEAVYVCDMTLPDMQYAYMVRSTVPRGTIDAIHLPEFPEGAWEPVFCTWYAVHAAVTQDWVEKNAEVASRLGFRTLIIDDGWCFDVMKRVSPETISTRAPQEESYKSQRANSSSDEVAEQWQQEPVSGYIPRRKADI